jgi:ABC-2 type transport system ATP-binding protein
MAGLAVVADGLGKRFGRVTALDGVDFELPAGGVLGLLGPNGAGKTTAVRILATLLRPDRGRAAVAGFDVTARPDAVRKRIGLSGQYAAVDQFLTGRENLIMIARLYGLSRRQARQRADELIGQLGLAAAAGRLVRGYSGGMRRRLDVAASLLAAPAVVFLDEPSAGLDPRGRLELWQALSELTSKGTSLLLTTQHIEEAERLAGMIVIIDHGKVIASGTPGQLRARAGGDRLELQSPPGQDARRLAGALAAIGTGEPAVDEATGLVVLPVSGGAGILGDVAGRLAASGLRVSALALRRPTLEEAFLALTGQPAQHQPGPAGPPAAQPGSAPGGTR